MTVLVSGQKNSITSRPPVTVVIVNFNGGDYLQSAVDSLKRQTFSDFETIIWDNASTDGSVDGLDLTGLDHAVVVEHDCNIGFARANNLAAQRASGEWLALLNPDAAAEADWLAQLVAATHAHPDARMFASAQYSLDAPDLMDGAGDCYAVTGFPWRGGYGRSAREMPETGECFSPCGAGALFHRETFLEVGGFDESFFCYCEDVDIAFRLRLMGHRCVFWRPAVIRHAGSALSNKVGDFAAWHGARNRFWTYVKNMPSGAFWAMLAPHLALTVVAWARGIPSGRARAVRRGFGAALAGLPTALRQRRNVQASRTVSSASLLRSMCWNPLIMARRKTFVQPLAPAWVCVEARDGQPVGGLATKASRTS